MPSTICGWKDPLTGQKLCTTTRWKVGATYCSQHEAEYRALKRQSKGGAPSGRVNRAPQFTGVSVKLGDAEAPVIEGRTHSYVVSNELGALWNSEMTGATKRPAGAFLFIGPSGSGKTDGAESLAAMAALDFTKADAASMTDPESWFGTREIVVQDGVAVTDYRPSAFAESIQKPGVTFIDEITRCRPEGINILIPILDHTRQVTNPLTGEIIHRHPQNIIIMAGNVGVNFVGTNAVDPAFWTRATKVVFDYLPEDEEKAVVMAASGCDLDTAYVLVQFAADSRAKAGLDDEFAPISTRELIRTATRVADGLDRDLAVKFEILNGVSDEGGKSSIRNELTSIWNGKRAAKDPSSVNAKPPAALRSPDTGQVTWTCPAHGGSKVIPAGTSRKTGQPYNSFRACAIYGCPHTEDTSGMGATVMCGDCGHVNPVGRTTICENCGATL